MTPAVLEAGIDATALSLAVPAATDAALAAGVGALLTPSFMPGRSRAGAAAPQATRDTGVRGVESGHGAIATLSHLEIGLHIRMKRLFFIVMVGLWGAFIALAVVSPETLTQVWEWTRDLWWPLQIVVWIVFLPWMMGLWVWQTDWSSGVRMAVIVMLAIGWSAASFPRK